MSSIQIRRCQKGQAMVEYIVVVGALVSALIAAPNVIQALQTRMQAKQTGYNYAVSLSTAVPPADKIALLYAQNHIPPKTLKKLLDAQKAMKNLKSAALNKFPNFKPPTSITIK